MNAYDRNDHTCDICNKKSFDLKVSHLKHMNGNDQNDHKYI